MRFLLAMMFAVVCSGAAQAAEPVRFVPTPEQIAQVEASLKGLPQPLENYARYYAGMEVSAVRSGQSVPLPQIFGKLIPLEAGDISAVHVQAEALSPLKAEGCITFWRAPPDEGGNYTLCTEPGVWEPSELDVAEAVRRLGLPKDAKPFASYARYYGEITQNGERYIRMMFVLEPAPQRILSLCFSPAFSS